ncbi:GNAT family N-acetyltransferase [Sphingomonas hankyongi]|uniref:GNAT family N-acetyltransferase n=1 Tax=Sphingomonas hankyongi TaxID=2908209 RepID=A0ABT0S3P6_9SPHN|nr:GNAT family N-acetyltransferase [Sphingomonas hankyongi]MCL6730494.1 GNAT family N-acetyltransferase [Sphingomonas hankyongi]
MPRFSSLTSAPELETERLLLRGFREDDLDEHAAILSDPVVMEHFGGHLFGREDSWRRLLGGVGLWSLQGTGLLAAERKSDGKLVGHVGLFDYHREISPSIEGVPELGYIFAAEVHGRGIAREACDALLKWADRTLDAQETVAIISIGNMPSIKLAERLGYQRQPDGVYREEPISLWRRQRRAA